MLRWIIAIAALSSIPAASGQEIVDQDIRADTFIYNGAKARETAPPPKPEIVDQNIRTDAFIYTGAKARAVAPPPKPEIVDQDIRADTFVYRGARAREN